MNEMKKKVALLSNVTVDLITAKLRKKYDFYLPAGYDTWAQEIISPVSGLYSGSLDAVIILLDGTEARSWKNTAEAEERITLWKHALSILADKIGSTPIFVSTVDIRENKIKSLSERKFNIELENNWYQFLQRRTEEKGNIFVLDIKEIITEIGRRQFYSNKIWYMSSMPYSRDGLNAVVAEIDWVLRSAFAPRKKIIVLDLDNTLWGGVIGEDGINGIELSDHKEGQRYYDFQRQLLEIKNRGIMLALNSKNNETDAANAIQNHPSMLLRDADFIARKINWENKAVNLKALESELKLTEGGFIFIDDNPVEREIVKGECPEVLVPDFPTDTTELLHFAEQIWVTYCRPLKVLDEDLEKTQMYQNEARGRQELKGNINLEAYIEKLEITVDIHRMRLEELERVTQLCNKTNQFNLTTKRYSRTELEKIAADDSNVVYVMHSADKYGDNGLICVLILFEHGTDVLIDTFLMSCRIIGRKLEELLIARIAEALKGRRLIGEYIPTEKNTPVKDLYDRLGFMFQKEDNGSKRYELLTSENAVSIDTGIYKEVRFEV